MEKVASEKARRKVLTDDELCGLWAELDAHPGNPADAIRLRLLTGQRGGEVHRIAWDDVDMGAGAGRRGARSRWCGPQGHAGEPDGSPAVSCPRSTSA